jgi:hypothetical protein
VLPDDVRGRIGDMVEANALVLAPVVEEVVIDPHQLVRRRGVTPRSNSTIRCASRSPSIITMSIYGAVPTDCERNC